MRGILLDVILVLVLVILALQIGGWALARTRLGVHWRQDRNRRLLERGRPHHCPVHGDFADHDLVRLPSGETLCPQCYEEIYHAELH